MQNNCLNCFTIWEDTSRHHYCKKCQEYLLGLKFDSGITVVHKVSLGNGKSINKGHLQHINSRVVDDNGNTLSGKKGVEYMKSKGDKYAGRLKGYYEPKI